MNVILRQAKEAFGSANVHAARVSNLMYCIGPLGVQSQDKDGDNRGARHLDQSHRAINASNF